MPAASFKSHTPEETSRIGATLGRHAEAGDLFLLCGELGSGKTCLAQGIARGLGIEERVGSPTFILVSIHQGRLPLYHIDLYRLDHVAEVLDLGLEEYLEGDGVSVVEWADKALEVFSQPYLLVTLSYEGEMERLIRLEPRGERYDRLVQQVRGELGKPTGPVVIAEYDHRWPILYEEERARILGVIGHRVVATEHVGSTAVPGLGAKPIIDIMAAVRSLTDAQDCISPLQGLGYEYVPENEFTVPDRRYFHKGPPEARTHHLHMVELASDFWERHLLFRDYLRTHPEEARQYEQLKRELAARFGSDRVGYTDAKTSFIQAVEEKARAARGTL